MKFKNIKILNTEPSRFSEDLRCKLNNIANTVEFESDREYLIENIHKFDGILVGLRNKIDQEILCKSNNLKFIITPTTGLNHIDLEFALNKNIDVISLHGEQTF